MASAGMGEYVYNEYEFISMTLTKKVPSRIRGLVARSNKDATVAKGHHPPPASVADTPTAMSLRRIITRSGKIPLPVWGKCTNPKNCSTTLFSTFVRTEVVWGGRREYHVTSPEQVHSHTSHM